MSLLKVPSEAQRYRRLESLTPQQVRTELREVLAALQARNVLVRREAALALARGGLGERELQQRLHVEKSPIVATEFCSALANLNSTSALPSLRKLARRGASQLVRRFAAVAVADIGGKQEAAFLRQLLRADPSRRVKASVACALVALGETEHIAIVISLLRYRDPAVRCTIANLLRSYRPRAGRSELVHALESAVKSEERPGVRGDLQAAITELSP